MRLKLKDKAEYLNERIKHLSGVDTPDKGRKSLKKLKKASKKKKPTVGKLIKQLDTLFAQYVKLRDTDENGYGNCCTCHKSMMWVFDGYNDKGTNQTNRNFQLGHFIKRERYMTRWEDRNTAVQCGLPCNSKVAGKGEQFKFSLYLNTRYGESTAKDMAHLSDIQWKPGLPWLREQIIEYKSKVKELLIDKNFEI